MKGIEFEELPALNLNSPHPGWKRVNSVTYIHHYHNFWRNLKDFKGFNYLLELEGYLNDINPSVKIFHDIPFKPADFHAIHGSHKKIINELKKEINAMKK